MNILLAQTELQLADDVLDGQAYIDQSSICHLADNNVLHPTVADMAEIFPNPYCINFFVKRTTQATTGNWICEVYDFYGNLLRTNPLEQDEALQISPRNRQNVLVVLRRDGEVVGTRAVLRLCR